MSSWFCPIHGEYDPCDSCERLSKEKGARRRAEWRARNGGRKSKTQLKEERKVERSRRIQWEREHPIRAFLRRLWLVS